MIVMNPGVVRPHIERINFANIVFKAAIVPKEGFHNPGPTGRLVRYSSFRQELGVVEFVPDTR